MRDAQALQFQKFIDHDSGTEVGIEKSSVDHAEALECQGRSGLLLGMDRLFEFGKHRLPEEGAAQIVNLAIDQVGLHRAICRFSEKMLGEQDLIERRGHLGQENGIVVGLEIPGTGGIPGMHRVTRLMSQRVDV